MGEGLGYTSPSESRSVHKGSSPRLMFALERQIRFLFGAVEVIGTENLKQLNPNTKFIFATSHTSDNDIPLAAAVLGHDFDLVISDMSVHTSLRKAFQALDPTILGMKIAGKDNFLPISHSQEKEAAQGKEKGKLLRRGRISKADVQAAKEALDRGKSVVIAAHNRSEGVLPVKPGYLAVRVAQMTENAVVVPVAVQIGGPTDVLGLGDPKNILETRRIRPTVKITIGEPLKFDDPQAKDAGDVIEEIWDRNHTRARQEGDGARLFAASTLFKSEGARLLQGLASMFPPEKRGVWQLEGPSSDSSPASS